MIIDGTQRSDDLTGTDENDTISGFGGGDLIEGGLGDDILNGGNGPDEIIGGDGNDILNGGIGNNILNGGNGADVITFGAGEQTVNGGAGRDTLELNFSDLTENFVLTYNPFEGGSLTEDGILEGTTIESIELVNLTSGAGDDFIDIAASLGSTIITGAGDDTIIGGSGEDSLEGETGNDFFFGNAGDDRIIGGEGNDAAGFSGLASNYQVVLREDFVEVIGGPSEFNIDGEIVPIADPEFFTDTLSEVEIILFDNGEVITENGEFIFFEEDSSPDEAATVFEFDDDDVPVYEFFRTDTQTQFYTTEENERDVILDTLPDYELEGISFVGVAPPPEGEDITGISPVYRFFNTATGIHLYTVDENERAFVEENLDNYVFESIPYYGFDTQEEGTVPLYRFYNAGLDAHFYTASEEERDFFIESADYTAEGGDGIAFYVDLGLAM